MNSLDRTAFTDAVGWVFECSPWVAKRAWHSRPFPTVDALHNAMFAEVENASRDEQIALLRAHPDLGSRTRLSDPSTAEQAGAGLDHLTEAAFDKLQRLNAHYRDKFGFPFLLAVKGNTMHDILLALEARVEHDSEQEFEEALRQVSRIARFRLESAVD